MSKILNFLKSKFCLAIIAGALCNLAFAPIHFFPIIFISLPIFYWLCEKAKNTKEIVLFGWCYGFGYFLAGVYWIAISLLVDAQSFAWLIPFALTLIPAVLALYFTLLSYLYKFLTNKIPNLQNHHKIIIFAICWTLCELLRAFLFTGFPWNLIGYSFAVSDYSIQIASIFGVWGLTVFAVLLGLLPILFLQINNKRLCKITPTFFDKIFAITILTSLFWVILFGVNRIANTDINDSRNLKLRLVQGNIKQDMKWNPQEKYRNLLKHVALSDQNNSTEVAAVIWSESSVSYAIEPNSEIIDFLKKAVPQTQNSSHQGVLITGALRLKTQESGEIDAVWNSVFAINNSGIASFYDKHHLVPFGEYVPLQKYLPFVQKITDGAIGFSEGEGPKTVHTELFSFSPLLCYEVIFPDKIIDKKDRPDLLVNLTNDAWFGNSSGPYQHFEMAKMRAVEYGIPLVRVANTGISAFFDPWGRVIDKINLNQEGKIDVNLVKKLEPTTYSRYSFAPLFLLVVSLLIFFTTRRNVVRQNHSG